MDLMKHRLPIAVVLLLVMAGGTAWALQKRDTPSPAIDNESATELPALERDAIEALEITRAGGETIRVEREGDEWRLVAPLEAEVEESTVNAALDKLTTFEMTGHAATRAENHERLEVDAAHGVHVVAHGESGVLANLFIGAFRGGNTMVRIDGEDPVLAVRGSVKYAFDKELKEWRNRRIVNEDPAHVRAVAIDAGERHLRFERNAEDQWVEAAGQAPIERFSAAKVQSIVSTLARMRATDFAAEGVSAEQAGLAEPAATVTLSVVTPVAPPAAEAAAEGAEGAAAEEGEATAEATPATTTPAAAEPASAPAPRTIVIKIGGSAGEGASYVQREGSPLTYTVSSYVAERMQPADAELQAPEPGTEEAAPAAPPSMGAMGGMGGGGQQIPPELMQQIQQQLRQQGGAQ
jgi:hypothetical protein